MISKDSTEFSQFSQFFAVFTFPSVYCIDHSGKPLVVMTGKQTAEVLRSKLSEAFVKMQEQVTGSSTDHGSVSNVENSVIPERQSPEVQSASLSSASGGSASESHTEKLKRYEEKIKKRRDQKSEAKNKHEIQQEVERRSQGKDVMKLKDMQAEQRNKNWLKERQKQKEHAQLARDQVRAKLEQDRREREDKQRTASSTRQRSQTSTSQPLSSSTTSTSAMCRVQLRLPMGSTKVVELRPDDPLRMLRERVSELLDTDSTKLSLVRLYPREELTTGMDLQSMVDLKLAPSGVIIVKVDKMFSADNGGSNVVFTTLMNALNFVLWIFSMIKKCVVGFFSSPTEPPADQEARSPSRSDGQLHKFRQEDYKDEDSDDMGTYNGNSTQQQ